MRGMTYPMAAQIGVTGLAVMGGNLARNLARNGRTVALHNRTQARTDALVAEHGDEGDFVPSTSMKDFVASLERPRRVLIMVKAGPGTDAVIDELADLMDPGDVIVDGGNAHFLDTRRREAALRGRGLHFVGTGISGGEEGALNGPSIMPGGSAEAYDLLRAGLGLTPAQIAEVFRDWNSGELESYLVQITAEVLGQVDAGTGRPFVDVVADAAEQKGTGRWTVQTALDLGVPVSGIAEAVFARSLSGHVEQRRAAHGLAGPSSGSSSGPSSPSLTSGRDTVVEDVRRALYASKVVAYAQGFEMLRAGSLEYGWDVDLGAMATIWRGGCIIRAAFLDRIRQAYDARPELPSLLLDAGFADTVGAAQDSWRRVVAGAATGGIPAPGFGSALAYYDGLRRDRSPAALIQGLRDDFGAHTYRRIDKDGTFHTEWARDGKPEHPA